MQGCSAVPEGHERKANPEEPGRAEFGPGVAPVGSALMRRKAEALVHLNRLQHPAITPVATKLARMSLHRAQLAKSKLLDQHRHDVQNAAHSH